MRETGAHRLLPLYAGDQPAVRAARGADDAARRGGACRRSSRRHARHGEATRRAVAGWGLEVLCADPREYSNSLTAVLVPDGYDADRLREIILDGFDMSLGTGLGKLQGQDLPHRPSRPFQRSDAVRHAVRGRDGAAPRRHPAPRRRRRRGARIPGLAGIRCAAPGPARITRRKGRCHAERTRRRGRRAAGVGPRTGDRSAELPPALPAAIGRRRLPDPGRRSRPARRGGRRLEDRRRDGGGRGLLCADTRPNDPAEPRQLHRRGTAA